MRAFYNELDAFPAAWMRNLIDAGHIAPGTVDERSIVDLQAADLDGYTQAHFFAGIGVWSYALRLAVWPDDAPVWTGSCPCQPFSAAGKRGGADDERHLWPAWFRLIRERRPGVVFGEQVASRDGIEWLDAVQADMEGIGYAVGAVAVPVAAFGAPHARLRTFFVAHADQQRAGIEHGHRGADATESGARQAVGLWPGADARDGRRPLLPERPWRGPGWLTPDQARSLAEAGATRGFWGDADWWLGIDGKARPIGPGLQPLVDGAPARMGRLRAYGNCIAPQVAAEFVRAYMDTRHNARGER